MSIQEQFVQQFTRLFQHYTGALSPAEQQEHTGDALAFYEADRLVVAARLAILEMETNATLQQNPRRYYAKPGEAEWGC